jgi:DNA-binding NtrC family response regulator
MKHAPRPTLPLIIVDDELQALESYETALRYGGFDHIIACKDSRELLPLLAEKKAEVLVLDLLMPHRGGEELLDLISRDFPQIPIIVVTGVDDVGTAVRCMKMGAFDYLVKPIDNELLTKTVTRAIDFRDLERENRSLNERMLPGPVKQPEAFSGIITRDSAMEAIFRYLEATAGSPRPVLITGETGVGKELFARVIHELSGRTGPFLAVNVSGMDDSLFADTLFGHAKGAYTGADCRRCGLIEGASGGTLFLDEIGDLSTTSQVKLLRLLQENEYLTLGEDLPRRADARILASTNRDIVSLQEKGLFRKDLFYRLCTHHIVIPPLRERRGDLPVLLVHFLEKASRTLGKKKPTVPSELMILLATYSFPGNVRELEAMVFEALSLHVKGVLSMETFKTHIAARAGRGDRQGYSGSRPVMAFPDRLPSIKEATLLLVDEAMSRSKGNISIAAGLLGISHQALRKRLKKKAAQTG